MSGSLTHSPAQIVQYLLVDEVLGTLPESSSDWPISVGAEPDSPDSCITVYDTVGDRGGRLMYNGRRFDHYGIQLRVRAAGHVAGYTKAQALAVALDEDIRLDSVSIGSSVYLVYAISRKSDVLPLGKDLDSGRNLFTINAVCCIRQTT